MNNSVESVQNVVVLYYPCSEHGLLVALDGSGGLIGRCAGCQREAEQGEKRLRARIRRRNLQGRRKVAA